MSQIIRAPFVFFSGSQVGGTGPTGTNTPMYTTATGQPSSDIVFCAGLSRKTFEVGGAAADLAANPILIEGTISEGANDKVNWFAVTGAINVPGLFTIAVGAAPLFYEPELTHLRIRPSGQAVQLPNSIQVTFQGFWHGDEQWIGRIKGKFLEKYSAV